MVSELLVKAIDLSKWADTTIAKGRFPELLRRLCFATANDPQMIEFATGEGTALHGYDGITQAGATDPHVPQGTAVWELSTEKRRKGKAKGDFSKRAAKPGPFSKADTTYVACTLRPWDKKEVTVGEWAKLGWKEVRLYDCNSLEAWLQRAPAVHLWISRLLGKALVEAWDLDSFWENWSRSTNPSLTFDVVLAGYEEASKQFLTYLDQGAPVIQIRSESPDFSRAFAVAVLANTKGDAIERLAARTVVVSTPSAWKDITSQHSHLILIPEFDVADLVGAALANGHIIVQALGQEHRADTNVIMLRQRHATVIKDAVEAFWPKKEEAYRISERIASGIVAFRRSISLAAKTPEWARPGSAEILIPALLAGSWDGSFEGDQQILEVFSGEAYDQWLQKLRPWLNVTDAPIRQNGSVYCLVDRRDSWFALSPRLDDGHLGLLEQVTVQHLSQTDPRWDADEQKRRTARLNLDKSGVSMTLKAGLADTVALLGALGEEINRQGTRHGSAVASTITWKLFQETNTAQQLCTISPFFSNLAEASPEQFLSAMEGRLSSGVEEIKALFQDREHDFFSSLSPHTNLIWSLEILAWNPTLLSRVAILLARITELDPGGKTANRPAASLREIFLPWCPGTAASLDERLKAIDLLRKKTPGIAWSLIISLLPTEHDVSRPTTEAQYRPWGQLWSTPVKEADVYNSAEALARRAIADAGKDVSRWIQLIDHFSSLHYRLHDSFFAGLAEVREQLSDEDRSRLWHALRQLVTHHSRFLDADWAMPSDILDRFRALESTFTPHDPVSKWAWLFEQWVELPGDAYDYDGQKVRLAALRQVAVNEVLREPEVVSFIAFAEKVAEPGIWGHATGLNRKFAAEADFLESHLAPGTERLSLAARGYVLGRTDCVGKAEIQRLLDQFPEGSAQLRAGLYRCMALDSDLLHILHSETDEVRRLYWADVARGGGLFLGPDLLVTVTEALLDSEGYLCAIQTLSFSRDNSIATVPHELILRTIEGAISMSREAEMPWGHLAHDLGVLLDALENVPSELESRVLVLELLFARLLSHSRVPKISQRVLAKDPSAYMDLISAVFKDEDGNPPKEEEAAIPADNAYQILQDLRSLPGQSGDHVSAEILSEWVRRGVELAKVKRRGRMFLGMLGQWLARSPAGTDGLWPHEAVRDIVEELESDKLEDGMQVAIQNLRGVYMKSLAEGGDQERALASKYRAWQHALSASWPRTARVLGRVAASYDSMAIREDQGRG